MPRNPELWVIDASVATKWHLRDEPMQNEADSFREQFQEGTIAAVAPNLSVHEVASAISVALWAGRITQDDALSEIDKYTSCGLAMGRDPRWLVDGAARIAIRLRIPYYDSVYLALAQELEAQLVTWDRKLYDAVRGRLPFVRWLGDAPLI